MRSLIIAKRVTKQIWQDKRTLALMFLAPILIFALLEIVLVVELNGIRNAATFNHMAPHLLAYLVFFFVFLISGIVFLRERINGTLERLFVSPVSEHEIVLGYFLGFGLFVTIQTVIIQVFLLFVLDVPNESHFLLMLLVNLLLAATALSIGILCSAFARTEFQLIQFIPIVIVPQIVLAGMFDIAHVPDFVMNLSKIMPLPYGSNSLHQLMIHATTIQEIIYDILILLVFVLVFQVLATLIIKKHKA
ncbi:MAG: ABC transporter permease [Clostridiales bacterium]|nr:ABC transporter permease [Clostridiales bacterium]